MAGNHGLIYKGNCHCGNFRFELHLQQALELVYACPYSICVKKGTFWVYPRMDELKATQGEENLTSYTPQDYDGQHYVSYYPFQALRQLGPSDLVLLNLWHRVMARNHVTPTKETDIGVNVSPFF